MNDLANNQTLMLLAALVAVLLVARLVSASRFGWRAVAQTLAGWAVVALVAVLAIGHRDEIGALLARADRFGQPEQKVEGDTIRIPMSRDGHFWASVTLNGVDRDMLIDSGATITALSEATARDARIPLGNGLPVIINTANGAITAQTARAARVKVGPLETRDLEVVVAPSFGDFDVLGMNFLSRLKSWRVEGKTLVLEPASGKNAAKRDTKRQEKGHARPKRESH